MSIPDPIFQHTITNSINDSRLLYLFLNLLKECHYTYYTCKNILHIYCILLLLCIMPAIATFRISHAKCFSAAASSFHTTTALVLTDSNANKIQDPVRRKSYQLVTCNNALSFALFKGIILIWAMNRHPWFFIHTQATYLSVMSSPDCNISGGTKTFL